MDVGEFVDIAKALDEGDSYGYWHSFMEEIFEKNQGLQQQLRNYSLLVAPFVRSVKHDFVDETGELKITMQEICRKLDDKIHRENPQLLGRPENVDVC